MRQQQPKQQSAAQQFPTLAGWVSRDAATFKKDLDALAAAGRGLAGKPAAQRAVQEAVKLLTELQRAPRP
jgi:hypothetical protein